MRQERSRTVAATSSGVRRRMAASKRALLGLIAVATVVIAFIGAVENNVHPERTSPARLAATVTHAVTRPLASAGQRATEPVVRGGKAGGPTVGARQEAKTGASAPDLEASWPWYGPMLRPNPLTGIPAGWVASTHYLSSGGLARSYLMVRPPLVRGASLPVDVILHGRTLTPATMERIGHLLPVLGRAIAVYPAGWGRSWNAGGCCGVAYRSKIDDVAFLNTVIHQVLTGQHDASPRRVYLIGYSNGGRMAMQMACSDPGFFAGLAAVEAVPGAPCAATVPLPTVLVESTADPLLTIPVSGVKKTMQGYLEPTVGQTVEEWRQIDGCANSSTSVTTAAVTSTDWSSCRGRGRVVYDLFQGGSHRWPLGTTTTPSAQSLIAKALWGRPLPAAST